MVVAMWQQLSDGYMRLLIEPWIYLLMVGFVWVQYRRGEIMERTSFGVKVNFADLEWMISVLYGVVGGILASIVFWLLHVQVGLVEIVSIWMIIVVLMLIDVRLTCIAYAGPLFIVAAVILQWLASTSGVLQVLWLRKVADAPTHFASLIMMVGVLHVMEGILIFMGGWRGASPLFVESRRGQVIGAFSLQKFWAMPMVLGTAVGVVPFPVVIGFSTLTVGFIPKHAARLAASPLVLYGVLVTVAGLLARGHMVWTILVAVFTLVLHELLYKWVQHKEMNAAPLFVRPARGVRVLATILRSPARAVGLQPGDTMVKVGSMNVNSAYDIHFAIDQNPAYAKIEAVDLRGETRFLGTPIFEDDPHQLGVIMVPDEHAREYAEIYPFSAARWLFEWWRRRKTIGGTHGQRRRKRQSRQSQQHVVDKKSTVIDS
ncbi:hypothetical protein [Sulfoacidibacillus ferrooxidans]|uniref:PDZ domain-containing protein n=1 Tax=Sulfoacidibacillus ferrooxidans TaxID=2005001 RepID=A0A9X2AE29_9BACL|nr:hypothetical protein [Sulfoacidibacillus ferrooxidans]MCI0182726.1 hypothetical protein [Sulfoacidibacillus ferrooxidans]